MDRAAPTPPGRPPDPPRRVRSNAAREAAWGYFFIAPWIIGFLAFSLGPIAATIYLSLTEYRILTAPEWTGIDNFVRMFTSDVLYGKSLGVTAMYIGMRVPSWIVIGLLLAMLINRDIPGIRFFRTALYLPTIIPLAASAIIWMWMLNPQVGFLNAWVRTNFGVILPNWLNDTTWALPAIVLLGIWQIGQTMMIFLAGLQEVPSQLYEAADIDGANGLQKFRHITVPMMTPIIYFNTVVGVISAFQVFGAAFIMTAGGPANSTLFYILYLYRRAFQFLEMGYASAMSVVLVAIVLALTVLIMRTSDSWVQYERV
jgi:multiple sugar transport system permease protein